MTLLYVLSTLLTFNAVFAIKVSLTSDGNSHTEGDLKINMRHYNDDFDTSIPHRRKNKAVAGHTTNLGIHIVDTPNFDYDVYSFMPQKCWVVGASSGNVVTLFDSAKNDDGTALGCTNTLLDLTMDYNAATKMWRMTWKMFLLKNQERTYDLFCEIKLCEHSDASNACNDFAAQCSTDQCFDHPCSNAEYCLNSSDNLTYECAPKECTCTAGVGAVGDNCPNHNTEKCTYCNNASDELTCGGVCIEKVCQCVGGPPTTGASCPDHGDSVNNRWQCASCYASNQGVNSEGLCVDMPCETDTPCQQSAACSNKLDYTDYDCACPNTHTGKNCEIPKPCELNQPCQQSAACTNSADFSDYTCACPNTYTGKNCETAKLCELNQPCQQSAACTNSADFSDYTCACPASHDGKDCQNVASSICDTVPCQNNGACTPTGATTFDCECASYNGVAIYSGTLCETFEGGNVDNNCPTFYTIPVSNSGFDSDVFTAPASQTVRGKILLIFTGISGYFHSHAEPFVVNFFLGTAMDNIWTSATISQADGNIDFRPENIPYTTRTYTTHTDITTFTVQSSIVQSYGMHDFAGELKICYDASVQ